MVRLNKGDTRVEPWFDGKVKQAPVLNRYQAGTLLTPRTLNVWVMNRNSGRDTVEAKHRAIHLQSELAAPILLNTFFERADKCLLFAPGAGDGAKIPLHADLDIEVCR